MYTLNSDGSQRWLSSLGHWSEQSSPAVDEDGTLYMVVNSSELIALYPDQTQKWRYTADGALTSPVIAADKTIILGADDGYLYIINPNGTLKNRYRLGDNVICTDDWLRWDDLCYCEDTSSTSFNKQPVI